MRKRRYEKVISITTKGSVTNYPQKQINIKKSKVINPIIIFESDIDLIKKVETSKLEKSYEKRIRRMMYRATVSYWKEFEAVMLNFFDKLEQLSTEEGNKLDVIVYEREMIMGLA